MTAREALRLGTRGGAAVLGRDDIGSLEPGKCADFAVWRTDGLELGGAEDPVAGLVLSAPHRVDRLVVGGEDVVRGGALVQRRRERDRARPSGPGAKIRARERLGLDARPRHRQRTTGALASASSSRSSEVSSRPARPTPTAAIAELAARSRAGPLRARVLAAVALLHARGARGRARRGPPPHPAPRLAVRMRELPRQLTRRRARRALRRPDPLVELLAEIEDPLGRADDVVAQLSDEEKLEALDAHPAIGQRSGLSARSAAEQGSDADPAVLSELAYLNQVYEEKFGFRFVVFVAGRPKRRSSRCCASGSAGPARRSSTPAAASSSRSRGIDGPVPERRPRRPPADAARGRRDRVDRRVVLLRPARPRAAAAEAARGRGGGCRGRVLGRARRRPLPLAEVPARAGRDARAAALVQVGGVHDLALGLRADGRPLLLRRGRASRRPGGRRPRGVAGDRAQRRRPRARVARLRRRSAGRSASGARSRSPSSAPRSSRSPRGGRASCSRRVPRTCRSARCSGRSWPRTSSS